MPSTIWEEISHLLFPLVAAILLMLAMQALWKLLRRAHLLSGLRLASRMLTLLAGITIFLTQADLLLTPTIRGVLMTIIVGLGAIVILHIAETLFLLPYQMAGTKPPIPRLMRDIVRAVLFIVTVLVAISQFFRFELGTVVLSSTVLTAVIGLALQDLLKNVFSGIALELERPFQPGDWILIDGEEGEVQEMSWRAIRIRTRDGTSIVLPNSTISQQRISNFSTPSPVQARHLRLPIDSRYPPSQVQDVIINAALAVDGVLPHPAPLVRVVQFTPATTTYDLKYWLDNWPAAIDIESSVMISVWYHLRRESLPLANTELVILDPTQAAARLAPPSPEVIRETLSKIDLFSVLSEQEMDILSRNARVARYGRNEVLMRQGAVEDTLFVIQQGSVRVEVDSPSGHVVIKHLRQGKIIGEFGLLTGEPRSATVAADEDTVVIVIKRRDLAPILEHNPALPETLGKVLARRSAERMELMEASRASSGGESSRTASKGLARRIRNMFALLDDI